MRIKVETRSKARTNLKIRAKSKIRAELTFLASLLNLIEPANLDYTDLGEAKPNIELLERIFLLVLFCCR